MHSETHGEKRKREETLLWGEPHHDRATAQYALAQIVAQQFANEKHEQLFQSNHSITAHDPVTSSWCMYWFPNYYQNSKKRKSKKWRSRPTIGGEAKVWRFLLDRADGFSQRIWQNINYNKKALHSINMDLLLAYSVTSVLTLHFLRFLWLRTSCILWKLLFQGGKFLHNVLHRESLLWVCTTHAQNELWKSRRAICRQLFLDHFSYCGVRIDHHNRNTLRIRTSEW